MPLSPGTRLGPYEIRDAIGAGGMGEVYRAQDTRLDRTVAVKILPPDIAADPSLRERFEREARAVSSLNHPHICSLYDVGSQDGVEFLVMEYLEGETLADRLAKGPLALDKVLEHGMQIAAALDAAPRKGVIHRDLTPGNIMLTKSGAKLLDFGLAKVDQPKTLPLTSMTLTKPLTAAGSIIGTFQYMAPEQFEGREADARSDIFALGVVLYEMVTGRKAFEGKTQASVMVAILERDPAPLATVQPVTPPALDHLVATCVAKDPDQRRQCAHDVLLELKWIAETAPPAVAATKTKARTGIAWIAAAVLLFFASLALAILHFRERPPERQVLRYTVAPPEKTRASSFAVSPDGRYLAIVASGDSTSQLWVRALDTLDTQLLKGTDDAHYPFWSPDSRHIAFFAQGKLRRIAVNGGPAQTLCDASIGRGGAWNQDGAILFSPSNSGGLYRVSAAGGVPVPLKNKGSQQRFPWFLPDGRFLYLSQGGQEAGGIYLDSLDGKGNVRLLGDRSSPQYVAPIAGGKVGHLLFIRENTLMAQPVDPTTMQPAGELFPIAEQVSTGLASGSYGMFAVSANGLLVYETGTSGTERQLIWYDRSGKVLSNLGSRARLAGIALSPDEKRLLVSRPVPSQTRLSDLWMYDLERGTESRFTFHASFNDGPVWSPDGTQVAFASSRNGVPNLYLKAANGTGQEEQLLKSDMVEFPSDWSRDGRFIIFEGIERNRKYDVMALPVTGDRKPIPLLNSEFNERDGHLSPDGKWLAYASDETGRYEVYVQPFTAGAPGGGNSAGKWQISKTGGGRPQWRSDNKELFYETIDRAFAAVEILGSGATFAAGAPRALDIPRGDSFAYTSYAASRDGKRFLVSTGMEESTTVPPLTVVVNWLAGVKK